MRKLLSYAETEEKFDFIARRLCLASCGLGVAMSIVLIVATILK